MRAARSYSRPCRPMIRTLEYTKAESFAAFVHDVPMPPTVADRLAFFAEYEEFVAFRAAIRDRLGSIEEPRFEECG